MENLMDKLLGPAMPPHGHCYLWNESLVNLHVISDSLIVLAYFTIPAALVYLVWKRDDLRFNYMFMLFAVFIFACGTTHLMAIYNVWHGAYWLSGYIKAITAVASVLTAILVWPLIPKALAFPSNTMLRDLNDKLRDEVAINVSQRERLQQLSSNLESLVAERTAQLEEAKRLLEENNRALASSNQELEQFAYVASHDLKEPARKISAFGQILGRELVGKLDDAQRGYLDRMTDASRRMITMIEELLAYSRLSRDQGPHESLNLNEVMDDVERDLELQIGDSHTDIQRGPLPRMVGHRSQIKQLLLNVVSNAVKFSRNREHPLVEVGLLSDCPEGEVGFFVRDNGIGIAPENQQKIFGLFERLNPPGEFEGTGLGLAICQKILERHKARVDIVSDVGQGAEFKLYFPAHAISAHNASSGMEG